MTNVHNAYAYLKHMDLAQAAGAPHMSAMTMQTGDGQALLARFFSHEMAVMYLVDQGDNFTYVMEHDCEAAGITPDQLHEIGVNNLAKIIPTLQMNQVGGMILPSGSANFEASLMLVPGFWGGPLAEHCPNGVVVSVGARDTLGICDRSDLASIASMRNAVDTLWGSSNDHLLARDLYQLNADGTWTIFSDDQQAAPDNAAALVAGDGGPLDPATRTADVGLEEIVVANDDICRGQLTSDQLMKMHASGYNWNPTGQTFHRLFVGQPGAPARPWEEAGWHGQGVATKKRGFFRRR